MNKQLISQFKDYYKQKGVDDEHINEALFVALGSTIAKVIQDFGDSLPEETKKMLNSPQKYLANLNDFQNSNWNEILELPVSPGKTLQQALDAEFKHYLPK